MDTGRQDLGVILGRIRDFIALHRAPANGNAIAVYDSKTREQGLELLLSFHNLLLASPNLKAFEDASSWTTVSSLLDLFPLRSLHTFQSTSHGLTAAELQRILSVFAKILTKKSDLQSRIFDRDCENLIAGLIALSNDESLNLSNESQAAAREDLATLIAECPVQLLLPTLMRLLRPDTPSWARQRLSHELAFIPLRTMGVASIMDNVGYAAAGLPMPVAKFNDFSRRQTHKDLTFDQGVLDHISKILIVVPIGVDPEVWFGTISTQLYEIMDAEDDPVMVTAASYLISIGILGRKLRTDKTGEIRWRQFVQKPFLQTLRPDLEKAQSNASKSSDALVDSIRFSRAFHRLFVLVDSHPSPTFDEQIFDAILPSLCRIWLLVADQKSPLRAEIVRLFTTFFCAGPPDSQMLLFVAGFFKQSEEKWEYHLNSSREPPPIEIRTVVQNMTETERLIAVTTTYSTVLDKVFMLLSELDMEFTLIKRLFALAFQTSISTFEIPHSDPPSENISTSLGSQTLDRLVYFHFSYGLLHRFERIIAKEAAMVLDLVLRDLRIMKLTSEKIPQTEARLPANEWAPTLDINVELSQLAYLVLILLETCLCSPLFTPTEIDKPILSQIRTSLVEVKALPQKLNPDLYSKADRLESLIDSYGLGELKQSFQDLSVEDKNGENNRKAST